MSIRSSVRLRLETLGDRIVPSATLLESPEPPAEFSSDSGTSTTSTYSAPPVNSTSGGIEPIDPLGLTLPPKPTMPPIDPVKELAIRNSLVTELVRIEQEIDALDPNSPTYEWDHATLILEQGVAQGALDDTQRIALNVLAALELVTQLDIIGAELEPLLQREPASVEEYNYRLGLYTQYMALHGQLMAIVESTIRDFNDRRDALSHLEIEDPYGPQQP